MKKSLFLCSFIFGIVCFSLTAQAQLFYNARSSYDATGSSTSGGTRKEEPENKGYVPEEPYEKMVSGDIRERIKPDAAYILAQPDEVLCYGIARKSPKKRGPTLNSYAHTGNCGVLNDVGLAEVQKKILQSENFDMSVSKISSCIITPRLALRFRKGVDFVDAVISGGNCPGIFYLYGGETKEFYAKPMSEWLNTFIDAVSKDLEPVGQVEKTNDTQGVFVKRREKTDEASAPETQEPEAPAAPKRWGRQFD